MTVALETLREELEQVGLWELLSDPALTDLCINDQGDCVAYTLEGIRRHEPIPALRVESLIATIASLQGLVANTEHPILEATLPLGNVRVQAVLPPVSTAPIVAFRKPPAKLFTLAELVERGALLDDTATLLADRFCDERQTVMVSGGVGSGKTTLAIALLDELLGRHPDERLVVLEDGAREIHLRHEGHIRLMTYPPAGVTMRDLLRTALRLAPSRIIVGEARGGEAYDFLKACNTGHPGGLLTLHANSALEALHRLDSLVQEAGVSSQLARIVETIGLVVHLERRAQSRQVVELCEVEGLDSSAAPGLRSLFSR